MLGMGGGLAVALALPPSLPRAAGPTEIQMSGRPDGSHVWFDPAGLLIAPGGTVRWVNRDPANSHTATAYHPANFDHPRRIPETAEPWDSDYLLPGESFEVTLTVPGVYDYFCAPHEMAGMVGRIVVGDSAAATAYGDKGLPDAVIGAFPAIADIIARGRVSGNNGQHGK
jgi:plastocyanin